MKKIIFDTDIGIDDAMALLFLHYARNTKIMGIVTGFGNASSKQTTKNALFMKNHFELNTPIYEGASKPIDGREANIPDFVHGKNGLGNIPVTATKDQPEKIKGAEAIIEIIKAYPKEITIIAIGRLTNIAHALTICPELPDLTKEIIIMGGSFGINGQNGNVSPVAEANIAGDPKAADIVLSSNLNKTIVGLDVTTNIIMNERFFHSLKNTAGEAGKFIYSISRFYLDFQERSTGKRECPVHDPSAIAYLLKPEIFNTFKAPIRVATKGIASGQTIWAPPNQSYELNAWENIPTSNICTNADAQAVLDLFENVLKSSTN